MAKLKFDQDYEICREICNSYTSIVSLCSSKKSQNQYFVLKQMQSNPNLKKYIENELVLSKKLELNGAMNVLIPKEIFVDEEDVLLLLPFCEAGTYETYISKAKLLLSEDEAKYFTKQIVVGLASIHNLNYIYRTLKASNILMSTMINPRKGNYDYSQYTVYLSEFSVSKEGELGNTLIAFYYNAPEIKETDDTYNNKVDIWSLGICFYYSIMGEVPFLDYKYRIAANCKLCIPKFRNLSYPCLSLLECLLQYRPEDRPSCNEILNHPFFKESLSDYYLKGDIQSLSNKENIIIDLTKKEYTNKMNMMVADQEKSEIPFALQHLLNKP